MKFFKLLFILLLFTVPARADVIFPPFVKGIAISFEGIASYEEPLSKSATVNLWGGLGLVSSIDMSRHPAFGFEGALELRQYFSKSTYKGFNLDLYVGLANMLYPVFVKDDTSPPDSFTGVVPGLKLTYKAPVNSWLVTEPYFSFSTPVFSGTVGWVFTFGVRVGFNKVNK
jgi:hypothetical protein